MVFKKPNVAVRKKLSLEKGSFGGKNIRSSNRQSSYMPMIMPMLVF